MTSPLPPSVAAALKRDPAGLVAAVVQQHDTGEVLMVGWMDDEALHRTLTTGRTWFYSRSRAEYWRKGDTSGHVQHVRSVALDCDGDAVLVRVDQVGAACHTGEATCFDARVLLAGPTDGPTDGPAPVSPPSRQGWRDRRGRRAQRTPDLSDGATWPDLPTFRALARDRRVVPVVRRLLADAETPVGLYRKLAGQAPGTFLLESADHGGVWSRYSIVGAASAAVLTERDGQAHWIGEPPAGVPTDGDPLVAVQAVLAALATPRLPGLPPLTGGLVGVLGWDVVRRWERLEHPPEPSSDLPELALCLATDLAVVDHVDASVLLVANAVNHDDTDERVDEAWADAVARLDAMTAKLAAPSPSTVAVTGRAEPADPRRRSTAADYEAAVVAAKVAIRDGEVFQVVPSQRFEVDCPADALDVYRVLRATNPSPYMYLFRFADADGVRYDLVGSSPESLVKVTREQAAPGAGGGAGGTSERTTVLTHPIAGTRPRGATPEEDARLAADLLADAKERAEHLMLVDLARNDLARVCRPGTVDVVEFMEVWRYSHVMHLVSTVTGQLREGRTAYDALVSTFPAGTLSGAPKPRALALIDELEPVRRGLYGGTAGYLDFAGDLDMAITIRSAVITGGVARVQAGAGVVADSVPATEEAETRAKAAAVLAAIARAGALRPLATPGPDEAR